MLHPKKSFSKLKQLLTETPTPAYFNPTKQLVITKKSLDKAMKRLQGMLLRALAYDVEVKYMEGKTLFLADALSRAFLPVNNVQTQAEFETINAITFLPMREESITNIRDETERDESLQTVKR